MTKFGERLQQAARHAGVGDKQADIAADLGLTRQTVNHWFTKGEPDSENLAHIAKRWGVNYEWLRSGDGGMLQAQPDLPDDEGELLRDYRKLQRSQRDTARTLIRALRKSVVVVAAALPGFMAPKDSHAECNTLLKLDTQHDAGAFDNKFIAPAFIEQATKVILIACRNILSLLRNARSHFANSVSDYRQSLFIPT